MLEIIKAVMAEIAKSSICVDPAPMPGRDLKNVNQAFNEDLKASPNQKKRE